MSEHGRNKTAKNPPTTNRGVLRTKSKDNSLRSLDWLAWTIPVETEQQMFDVLEGMSDLLGGLTLHDRGWSGYSSSAFVLGTGRIGWDSERLEMGVHCSLPSKALGVLCEIDPAVKDDPRGFLQHLINDWGATFKRADAAIDDKKGRLRVDRMVEHVRRGDIRMRFRTASFNEDLLKDGATLYLGSRTSQVYLRAYDKRAQVVAAGEEDPGHPWVRCEMELKGEAADQFIRDYIRRGGMVIPGLIRRYADFKERQEHDSNKSRWPTCSWWGEFLSWAARHALALSRAEPCIQRSERWLREQVAATLSTVFELRGGSVEWLMSLIGHGASRRPPWQQALIDAQRAGESVAVAA